MRMTPKTFALFVPGLVLALAMMGCSTSFAADAPPDPSYPRERDHQVHDYDAPAEHPLRTRIDVHQHSPHERIQKKSLEQHRSKHEHEKSPLHKVEPPEIDATETAASRAVDQGLVGAVFGQVSITEGDTERESGFAGLRRIGSADVLNGQESFIIGSNTKAMTAVVAARLIERGVLRWDSTIGETVPQLQQSMRADYREVTLEQLLAHRGGVLVMTGGEDLQRFADFLVNYTDALPQTLVERRRFFANWLLTQPPPSGVTPRQDFYYSNAGYTLVAAMLEAVTGKPYETLFDEELTQPLGVAGSWVRPELMASNQPLGHEGARGQLQVVPPLSSEEQQWADAIFAPAGLFSTTAMAYSTWLHWHLLALQGQTTPLPAAYVQRLQQLTDGDYAVGWVAITTPAGRLLFHTGSWQGFMAIAVVDLAGQNASFGLTNTGDIAADGSSWVLEVLAAQLHNMDRRVWLDE